MACDATTPTGRATIRAALTDRQAAIVTLFGEARGESKAGMIAVMSVFRNRVAHLSYWGTTIKSVCLHPWAFSCWWQAGSNFDATYAFAVKLMATAPVWTSTEKSMLATIYAVVDGNDPDPTGGACFYDTNAYWAVQGHKDYAESEVTAVIGSQTFFNVP